PTRAQSANVRISNENRPKHPIRYSIYTPYLIRPGFVFPSPPKQSLGKRRAAQSNSLHLRGGGSAAGAMAFLLRKFQEAVKTLAKSPTFARDPRHLQFEADVNRLFLYTSYNRLGKNAEEKDVDEIIDMASKASVSDQQKQVQENIHTQIKVLCGIMDDILLSHVKDISDNHHSAVLSQGSPRRSGLSLAVGKAATPSEQVDHSHSMAVVSDSGPTPLPQRAPYSNRNSTVIPSTRSLTQGELSESLKDKVGYTLQLKPSQIVHKEAGQGLFVSGEAEVGSIVAFYPGVIYSPAYYRHIPGYPRIDAGNSYLMTRYDGIIINAQAWGLGGESREAWDPIFQHEYRPVPEDSRGSDRIWRLLSRPLHGNQGANLEVLERRNPLAFGHFANHPEKGQVPNIMVCPYDFPVTEKDMRVYIPNVPFGSEENVKMKRFGSFWFRSGTSGDHEMDVPVIKTLVLVATRHLSDEELFLNYRLSNSKRRPAWYVPVDEEEDRRRWS
ncbi:hypothetical protein Taro_014355, partial [Colocasia esculenta]|nr:hypothetical protein [Colocasia esculenta]